MGIDINISGATKLVGLVGSPVEHSMSPVMHSDSFQKMGVNAVYTAFDVTPDKLADVVKGLAEMGAVGYNVTMPCKTCVGQYLDELCDAGLKDRYGDKAEELRERLDYELSVINQMGYVAQIRSGD